MTEARWTSEARVLTELERLNDLSMQTALEYTEAAEVRARAEAAHKSARAKAVLRYKAANNASHALAQEAAEADEEVGRLHLARLLADAQADAQRELLRTIRTNQDSLRTAAASHRSPFSGP